jgi:uncharacterized protein (TIGR00661 family)
MNILNSLKGIDLKFEVFTDVKKPIRFQNCYFKPIDKNHFDESIKNCSGVITAAGFQTCSEALYLNKELIVIPINNQFEQLSNAESLKRLGVKVGSMDRIQEMINSPRTQKRINWKDPSDQIVKEILNLGVK